MLEIKCIGFSSADDGLLHSNVVARRTGGSLVMLADDANTLGELQQRQMMEGRAKTHRQGCQAACAALVAGSVPQITTHIADSELVLAQVRAPAFARRQVTAEAVPRGGAGFQAAFV